MRTGSFFTPWFLTFIVVSEDEQNAIGNGDPAGSEEDSGRAVVKQHATANTYRITPPKHIRRAVSMRRDEPWTWFYDPRNNQFYIRRSNASLSGIPDHFRAVGTVRPRKNGDYIDLNIPPAAVEAAVMEGGDEWDFYVHDPDTLQLIEVPA